MVNRWTNLSTHSDTRAQRDYDGCRKLYDRCKKIFDEKQIDELIRLSNDI